MKILLFVAMIVSIAADPAMAQATQRSKQAPGASKGRPSTAKPAAPPATPSPTPPEPAAEPTQRVPTVPMEVFAAEPEAEPVTKTTDEGPEEPSACFVRIADRIAVVEPRPSLSGPGDCGATDVVRLDAVIQPDKSRIALTPPATVRCAMAEAIAIWVREDLAPAAATVGFTMRALDNYASYDCRGRNRVAGAKISQHGLANAIDVRGINLANGKLAEFTDRALPREFRETIRKQACARFTTVLGPGSDGYHENHIHLDLAERRGGYRLCQWNVLDPAPDIPLPPPRPKEAP